MANTTLPIAPVRYTGGCPPLTELHAKRVKEGLGKGYFTDRLLSRYVGVSLKHWNMWRWFASINSPLYDLHRDVFNSVGVVQAEKAFEMQNKHIDLAQAAAEGKADPEILVRVLKRYYPSLSEELIEDYGHGELNTEQMAAELIATGMMPDAALQIANSIKQTELGYIQNSSGSETPNPQTDNGQSALAFGQSYYANYFTSDFADWHNEVLDWFTALQYGVAPSHHLTAIVNRGGGKSTITEVGGAFVGVTGKRKYIVYLSGTQRQANDHVSNVSTMLQDSKLNQDYPGAGDVALDTNNRSLGWKTTRLTSALGFTFDAIGIDSQIRGAKIDSQRIDLVIIDDIDSDSDTPYKVEKKLEALGRKILPAGSADLAVIGVQNEITSYSVFSRLKRGDVDVLQSKVIGPIPAIHDLVTDPPNPLEEFAPDGVKLVSGTPSWSGLTLEKCRNIVKLVGIRNFLAEYQHEVEVVSGRAFSKFWNESTHIIDDFLIPLDWTIRRAYDYGTDKPWCCLWYTISDGVTPVVIKEGLRPIVFPEGTIFVLDELYGWTGEPNKGDKKASKQQAQEIKTAQKALPFSKRVEDGPADSSIFTPNPDTGESISDIMAKVGVTWTRSNKEPGTRKVGVDKMKNMLGNSMLIINSENEFELEDSPGIFFNKKAENCIRTIPELPIDIRPNAEGDVDTRAEDHPWDVTRYIILDGYGVKVIKVERGGRGK